MATVRGIIRAMVKAIVRAIFVGAKWSGLHMVKVIFRDICRSVFTTVVRATVNAKRQGQGYFG